MKNIGKWISKNQGVFVAAIICVGMMVWTFECEAKVTSLTDPTKMVNAAELKIEIEAESMRLEAELDQLIKLAQQKNAEFTRQHEIRQKLLDFALLAGETGTLNPSGMIGLVAGILGVGAVVDNRIKDKVIKNRPLPAPGRREGDAVS